MKRMIMIIMTRSSVKVKLPGEWDADKAILEMGGVCVDHSQR